MAKLSFEEITKAFEESVTKSNAEFEAAPKIFELGGSLEEAGDTDSELGPLPPENNHADAFNPDQPRDPEG